MNVHFLAGAQGGSPFSSIIMIVLMLVVFYFFMIRPNMKKQKEQKKFRESLQPGDKIVTIGGIHGKILEVAESTVLVSSEGTKIRMDKSAIGQSLGSEELKTV
ncbi:MAG: preprotein translocase subunit YajC [Flavobacteriales bacterium]|jgi:preprotein translocase subunit YajC